MNKNINEIAANGLGLLKGLAANYSTVCLVDLQTKEYITIKTYASLDKGMLNGKNWDEMVKTGYSLCVTEEYRKAFRDYALIENVRNEINKADAMEPVVCESIYENAPWRKMQWLVADCDEDGNVTSAYFTVSIIDEGERKKIKTMKDTYDILDMANMGIWRINLFENEAPTMNCTDKMRELLGLEMDKRYTPEEIYEEWHSRICPEALDSVNKSVGLMLEGKNDENTYLWEHPTLGKRYVRCGGTAHEVPGKNGYNLMGYHYDVTDQIKAEMERNNIAISLAHTYACLFYVDLKEDTFDSFINEIAMVRNVLPKRGKFSEGAEEFKKHLCHPEYVAVMSQFVDVDTMNSRLKNKNYMSIQVQGLKIEWLEFSINVCDRLPDGSIHHMIIGTRDITDQKKAELEQMDKLRTSVEANKSKTVLLQNMTHEIRTPLNAMFGFSQLLSMPAGCITEEEKSEYFNYIYNGFNMLTMLIDDVLDMADAEHGNYRVNIGTVAVNEVCRASLQMAEARRPGNVKMYMTTDIDDSYTIESDGRRIQQVLINYLTNACKHTRQGEIHLDISTTENPGRLTFSVSDTGEGIPLEKHGEIFQRYKKANAMVQGSGLGLNICSMIAEKLNGEVKIDSSYTNGARFLFIL